MKENTEHRTVQNLGGKYFFRTFFWFSIRLQSIHLCLIEPRGAFRRLLACNDWEWTSNENQWKFMKFPKKIWDVLRFLQHAKKQQNKTFGYLWFLCAKNLAFHRQKRHRCFGDGPSNALRCTALTATDTTAQSTAVAGHRRIGCDGRVHTCFWRKCLHNGICFISVISSHKPKVSILFKKNGIWGWFVDKWQSLYQKKKTIIQNLSWPTKSWEPGCDTGCPAWRVPPHVRTSAQITRCLSLPHPPPHC